jgi:hypothetical protein
VRRHFSKIGISPAAWLVLIFFCVTAAADSLDRWTVRSPGLTENAFHGIAYGNGQFVAVGAAGTIVKTPDGVNWTLRQAPTSSALSAITYEDGQFVAVGDSGTIVTSNDGSNWVLRASGTKLPLVAITWGNGLFVAVGGGYDDKNGKWQSIIASSSDGVNWNQRQPTSADGSVGLLSVTFGSEQFVAVGNLASPTGAYANRSSILRSSDGVNWVEVPVINNYGPVASITYGNGHFVAAVRPDGHNSVVLTSADSLDWSASFPEVANLSGLCYGNGQFVGTVDGDLANSADGLDWVYHPSGLPWDDRFNAELQSIAYGHGQFVAVGDKGTIVTSEDGGSWTRREPKELIVLSDLTYGDGQFVAVGNRFNPATLAWEAISETSADGQLWTQTQGGPGTSFSRLV